MANLTAQEMSQIIFEQLSSMPSVRRMKEEGLSDVEIALILSDPDNLERRAMDAVNAFTRMKMRDQGFYRKILPPVQISNDELDRAIDTDLPIKVVDGM